MGTAELPVAVMNCIDEPSPSTVALSSPEAAVVTPIVIKEALLRPNMDDDILKSTVVFVFDFARTEILPDGKIIPHEYLKELVSEYNVASDFIAETHAAHADRRLHLL
jgi:hypothetical protein